MKSKLIHRKENVGASRQGFCTELGGAGRLVQVGKDPNKSEKPPAGGPCMASGPVLMSKGKQHLVTGQRLPKQSQLYQETSAAARSPWLDI